MQEFYSHQETKDGYLNKCKNCTRQNVTAYRNANLEKIRAYDRERADYKKITANTKKYRKLFPERYKAQTAISNAVRDKRLIKPDTCSVCNVKPSRLHGHHEDYSKPFQVKWVCAACHKALHKRKWPPKLQKS